MSAGAILKFVKVPRSISTLPEGESLFNDASSLIIFRFAMVAVATGQFIWQHAALSFGWMLIGGIGIGVVPGFIFLKVHRIFPTNVNMDTILTLVVPYIMYIAAEEVHTSGVLSVVRGGVFLSVRRYEFLRTSAFRLQGVNVLYSLLKLDLEEERLGIG